MKHLLIVDGYNLIHCGTRYKRLAEKDLDQARIRLIEDLAALAMLADYDVIVVFDAAATGNKERSRASVLGIEVWFTRGGESGDSLVERLAYEKSGGRSVTVVTSDYAQQKVVSKPGISVKSSRQLCEEVAQILEETTRSYIESAKPGKRPRLEDRIDGAVKKALDRLIRDF